MAKDITFLNSVDTDEVESLMNDTEKNVKYFEDTLDKVVKSYSESLDNLMSDLYVDCIKVEDPDIAVLEKYFLELANLLYFMVNKVEKLGIYDDMSKSAAKEVYSKAYLDNQVKEVVTGKNKTTVAELQANAELAAQYPTVVNSIYNRAYSTLKNKISAAQDMLSTLKKILSGRQAELAVDTSLNYSGKIRGN